MKKPIVFFLLALVVATVRAALPQPDLVAQIYFAGEQKIFAAPNVNAFTNEFCSPQALALRRQTVNKLAPWLATFLQSHTGAGAPNGAMWLRPLLEDLQTAEWQVEARATGNGPVEVALAIRLDDLRSQTWVSSLKPFFPAATFTPVAGWLIFDSSLGSGKLGKDVAQKALGPHTGWFSLDINWPRLAQWYPELGELGLPETQFTVTAPDNNLRIDGTFYYPQALALNLTPWQFPTNLVQQPLASFTAIRGFGAWYRSQDWAQPYQITPTPNEAYFWGQKGIPWESYIAVPVPDGDNALEQAYGRLNPIILASASRDDATFPFFLDRTNDELDLHGIPVTVPFIQSKKEPEGQYLVGGAFPITKNRKPLPPELFVQLEAKNLVYFDWEITALREPTMLQISQLGLAVTRHVQLDGDSAAYKWLASTTRGIGNTETQITQTAPDQLTFVRKAPGLFTTLEFFALANWLEAKNFPGCDLNLPPLSERIREIIRKRHAGTGMPQPQH